MSAAIKNELQALQQQAPGGLLQVETVVTWAAEHPASALHNALEWDDAVGGHQWRCFQVRQLIAINIRNEEGVREFVSLTIDRTRPGGGYRDLNTVMATPRLQRVLLQDALAELERVEQRYATVIELARVWGEIRKARRRHPAPEKAGETKQA